jgi:peptidoglycan-associated lipoprotein
MAPGGQIQIGGGPTVNREEFENMDADRAALAAYTVHFAYDSAAVRKSEKANVQAVADALGRDASTKLLIEGHCDERGTEEYNRSLGERRALALRQALAKIGVDPSRIRTISYGKDKPADPGHDESAWLKNRRGEFVLLHPKSGS